MSEETDHLEERLPVIDVQVVSDFLCPWCWIAKRRLEQAIRSCERQFKIHVHWEPFLLRPGIPPDGQLKPKLEPGESRVGYGIRAAAMEVGLEFTGKCGRFPNTQPAHTLVQYAAAMNDEQKTNDVVDAIFKMYFTDGSFPNAAALVALADKSFGLDTQEIRKLLRNADALEDVVQTSDKWRHLGVKDVPRFFMNGYRTFGGAQEPNTFVRTFERIATRPNMGLT